MTDGMTLKIDADTARFIAKIAQAAEGAKHLKNHAHDAGHAFHHMGENIKEAAEILTGLAIPLTLGGTGVALLEQGAEGFKEQLKEARDILKETQTLAGSFARVGLGRESTEIQEAMQHAAKNLTIPELTGIVGAVTAPGSRPDATKEDFARAAGVAGRAKAAGINPASFVNLWERLDANHVPDAEDLAYYQQKYIGENERFTAAAVKNPEQAAEVARYYAGAAASPDRATKVAMGKLVEAWTTHGAKGSFGDFLKSGLAVRAIGGREHLATLRFLQSHQGPEVAHGALAEAVDEANQSPITQAKNINDIVEEAAKDAVSSITDLNGFNANQLEAWDKREKLANAHHVGGAVGRMVSNIFKGPDIYQKYLAYGEGMTPEEFQKVWPGIEAKVKGRRDGLNQGIRAAHPFGGGQSIGGWGSHQSDMRVTEELLREQVDLLRRSKIKPHAQGEEAK